MFEVVEVFLIQLVDIVPFLIVFILVMNLICDILFGGR